MECFNDHSILAISLEFGKGNDPFYIITILLFSGAVSMVLLFKILQSYKTYRWKKVTGLVLAVTTEPKENDVEEIIVLYQYEYNGEPYRSGRISYTGNPEIFSDSSVDGYIEAYPPGSEVEVYVNPADPREAILEPGFNPFMVITFCLLLLLFGYTLNRVIIW